jgi:hypothetical protein
MSEPGWVDLPMTSIHEANFEKGIVRNKYSKKVLKPQEHHGKQFYTIYKKKYTLKQLKYIQSTTPTVPLPVISGEWKVLAFDPDYEVNEEEKLIRTRSTGHVLKNFNNRFRIKSTLYGIDDLINNTVERKPKVSEPIAFPQPRPQNIDFMNLLIT